MRPDLVSLVQPRCRTCIAGGEKYSSMATLEFETVPATRRPIEISGGDDQSNNCARTPLARSTSRNFQYVSRSPVSDVLVDRTPDGVE